MGNILSEVQRWRVNAEELRARAEGMSNVVAQDAMLDMAASYERLADRMENLAVNELTRKEESHGRR